MGGAGFEGIKNSNKRRQNTVAQYIATQPILDLCERSTQRLGARVSLQWWKQSGINLEGAKKRVSEAVMVLDLGSDSDSNADPGGEE